MNKVVELSAIDFHTRRHKQRLHLYYPLQVLMKEVSKRTAYLGKNRSAEGAPHLLDLIHMTEDEANLFDTCCRNAMSDLYDTISKYSIEIRDEDTYQYDTTDAKDEEYNHSIHYVMNYPPYLTRQYAESLDWSMFNALVCHIIHEWLGYAYPAEEAAWAERYQKALDAVYSRANQFVPSTGRFAPCWF